MSVSNAVGCWTQVHFDFTVPPLPRLVPSATHLQALRSGDEGGEHAEGEAPSHAAEPTPLAATRAHGEAPQGSVPVVARGPRLQLDAAPGAASSGAAPGQEPVVSVWLGAGAGAGAGVVIAGLAIISATWRRRSAQRSARRGGRAAMRSKAPPLRLSPHAAAMAAAS